MPTLTLLSVFNSMQSESRFIYNLNTISKFQQPVKGQRREKQKHDLRVIFIELFWALVFEVDPKAQNQSAWENAREYSHHSRQKFCPFRLVYHNN